MERRHSVSRCESPIESPIEGPSEPPRKRAHSVHRDRADGEDNEYGRRLREALGRASLSVLTGRGDGEDKSLLSKFKQGEEQKAGDAGLLSKLRQQSAAQIKSQSLLYHLKGEIMPEAGSGGTQEIPSFARQERVYNFVRVPVMLEKTLMFGLGLCLDAFLRTLVIVPLRIGVSLVSMGSSVYAGVHEKGETYAGSLRRTWHELRQTSPGTLVQTARDVSRLVIVLATIMMLLHVADASKMYHSVRGQETLKLYVIFNVMEVADKLCSSISQDVYDSYFNETTLTQLVTAGRAAEYVKPAGLLVLNFVCVFAHSIVLMYQLVALNIAINSYSDALLTLLISNQFVEIKGSVFKKFEKETLFQITCADIVERFQLGLLLSLVALRNTIEFSSESSAALLLSPGASSTMEVILSVVRTIFSPALFVLVSECCVDWIKHAFITKFNHIRPAVYARFIDTLCQDLSRISGNMDSTSTVSYRFGFTTLPITCVVVSSLIQVCETLSMHDIVSGLLAESIVSRIVLLATLLVVAVIVFVVLVIAQVFLSVSLRQYVLQRLDTLPQRLDPDPLAGGRELIGMSDDEKALHRDALRHINTSANDYPKKKVDLTNVGRYDMVRSRIW